MCGITIINRKNINRSIAKKSLAKITHRGYNLFEIKVIDDNCVMGTNRLAIVDRNLGTQPKSNEANTVFAVLNGEIYNHKKLSKELSKKGHIIKTNSDTEVLVHLWEEYGIGMIKKIDSEIFTFSIYDKRNKKIFLARDPIGIKPLYYAFDKNGGIYFASELKQLVQFRAIKEVREFPPGSYFYNNKFYKYFNIKTTEKYNKKELVKNKLKKLIEESVQKRVDTDLPIGVFLSGGVDSSLIMELATRYHKNVTALILGNKKSEDYKNAIKLCEDKGYEYYVINPKIDYKKNLNKIIYHLETYQPHIVRYSFANDIISSFAKKKGFRIILTGEGADEIFAGYNAFKMLHGKKINKGCELLLKSMSKGNAARIEKMGMKNTIEIRCPFFDTKIIKYGINISGKLKVKKTGNKIITKYILRELAKDYLPSYISNREKEPFANGAGMKIGYNYRDNDGILPKLFNINKKVSDKIFKKYNKEYPQYNFKYKEEVFYFMIYEKYNYHKLVEDQYRVFTLVNLLDI